MSRFSQFIYLTLILAFFSAGISPACQFISGQSFLEICTEFGTKRVAVSTDMAVPMDDGEQPEHQMAEHCLFCFAGQVDKSFAVSFLAQDYLPSRTHLFDGRFSVLAAGVHILSYEARGPPVFS